MQVFCLFWSLHHKIHHATASRTASRRDSSGFYTCLWGPTVSGYAEYAFSTKALHWTRTGAQSCVGVCAVCTCMETLMGMDRIHGIGPGYPVSMGTGSFSPGQEKFTSLLPTFSNSPTCCPHSQAGELPSEVASLQLAAHTHTTRRSVSRLGAMATKVR